MNYSESLAACCQAAHTVSKQFVPTTVTEQDWLYLNNTSVSQPCLNVNSVKAPDMSSIRHQNTVSVCYPELLDLGLDVTLGKVLDVGQLQVHLSQPHQDAVARRLKLLSLADEVLEEEQQQQQV